METVTDEFPFLLVTGRSLYQFNAGTMTMRTPNVKLRPTDTLDMSPADAERLGLGDGDRVRVRSRRGSTQLPLHVDPALREGTLFATFHTAETFLNEVTSPVRDAVVDTPEYKVTAVTVEAALDDAPARRLAIEVRIRDEGHPRSRATAGVADTALWGRRLRARCHADAGIG